MSSGNASIIIRFRQSLIPSHCILFSIRIVLTVHLVLVRWHVEWKCDQAKREFEALMEKDPRREDDENRQQRGDELEKAMEMERIKDIGGEEEAWNIIEGEHADDDARDCQFISLAHWGRMPYPGCECLLWGMCEMANKAINETIESFKGVCPVANSWAYCLMARIQERTLGGLQEIRDIVSAKPSKPDSRTMGQGPKDHFPDWQQDIIKKRIVDTVSEIKETIQEHGGAPGPIATAAHKIAEESLKRYRDKFYDRFDETLGSEDGASLELVASATEKMVEGVEISQCCSLLE